MTVKKITNRKYLIIEMLCLIIVVIIMVSVTIIVFHPSSPPPPVVTKPSDSCQQQKPFSDEKTGLGVNLNSAGPKNQVSKGLIIGEYIGISDGRFAFDTLGTDSIPKCQASLALASGNNVKAVSLWKQALKQESNDAEVAIYLENERILTSHQSYISLILGTTLTGIEVTIGRDLLQGAYVKQKEYNSQHPNAPQIRLLISNFGSRLNEDDLIAVAKQIKSAQNAQTIKGMIGFPPTTSIPPEVYDTLSTLPIVLPVGSNNSPSEGTNIFHVAATTKLEGQVGALYAEQNCPYLLNGTTQFAYDCPGQNIVLFMDASNTYSYSLGDAFKQKLQMDNKGKLVIKTLDYKVGDPISIANQVNTLNDPSSSPPDLIYFAGTAADANTLLQYLPKYGKYMYIRILGGDAIYELGGYTNNQFRRLDFMAFAYPDEWDWLNLTKYKPAFFQDYKEDFAVGKVGYGYDRADNDVILSYDALLTLIQGCSIASDNWTKDFTPTNLQNALGSITDSQALQAVSGRIAFGPDHNPMDKAIVILRVDDSGRIQLQKIVGSFT